MSPRDLIQHFNTGMRGTVTNDIQVGQNGGKGAFRTFNEGDRVRFIMAGDAPAGQGWGEVNAKNDYMSWSISKDEAKALAVALFMAMNGGDDES